MQRPEKDLILTITISCFYYSLPQLFSLLLLTSPVSSMLSSECWERRKSRLRRNVKLREKDSQASPLPARSPGILISRGQCSVAKCSDPVSSATSFSLSSDKKQFLEMRTCLSHLTGCDYDVCSSFLLVTRLSVGSAIPTPGFGGEWWAVWPNSTRPQYFSPHTVLAVRLRGPIILGINIPCKKPSLGSL